MADDKNSKHMADDKKANREDRKDTETPPHGDPLIERNMENIAEANLPKADEEQVPQVNEEHLPQVNEANEQNRDDARPGTNT